MNYFNEAASLLPIRLYTELLILPESLKNSAEEIRLRAGQPLSVIANNRNHTVGSGTVVCTDDIYTLVEKATCASYHTYEHSLAQGYISVHNGIRIGVCGTAVNQADKLKSLNSLSSAAVRIPRQVFDCANDIYERITQNELDDTLIISPPGAGKTTCMRDFIRRLSDSGVRVAVADERGELAAVYEGEPQFDVGKNTDVITGAKKSVASMMLIRSMNPQVLAMDEISAADDVRAIGEAAGCGVRLLATAHGTSIVDLRKRNIYRELLNMEIFKNVITIENHNGRQYRLERI